jgi:hypothetical protein
LVVAVLLMVLLTVVAVGMLGLSVISLRTSGQSQAMAVAQANARLGMMLALGELQATLGPDQRVSASAAAVIKSPAQPHLTGAWDSWRWDPAGGGAPSYAEKSRKFRRWLVSTKDSAVAKSFEMPSATAQGDTVELVGDLTHRKIPNSVRAAKLPVAGKAQAGSLAWAVFDESAKATIDLGDPEKPAVAGEEVATRNAPPRFRADALDSQLASLEKPKNLISLETPVIPAGPAKKDEFRRRFHDFTTGSLGLLTDTANGGLKTDLTSLFEAPTFPKNSFPADTLYATTAAGAPRWNYLYEHYRKYKSITSGAAGTPTYIVPSSDLAVSGKGIDPSPQKERLLPVIVKMQMVFSIVSHHAHIGNRVNIMNQYADPKGNDKHAVPHLAYDPVITLYNPYDVALQLNRVRIRIWDPPVGFRFIKKDKQKGTSVYYRPEMAQGQFHGLARLGYQTEKNPASRKYFTLVLTEMNSSSPGKKITLQPGEVRVFSPWVNKDWTWGWETAGGYDVKAFFDFAADKDFGNRDGRTKNNFGVESVPGWEMHAGLQTDHMSYSGRPAETLYDYEKKPEAAGAVGGYLSMRLTDEVEVEIKPMRTLPASNTGADFMVELLSGTRDDYPDSADMKYSQPKDLIRRYRFVFNDVTSELSETPDKPTSISRSYIVKDTMQRPTDKGIAGKKCFAMLEMTARTTRDPLDDSKAWLYNNPVVEGGEQLTREVGVSNQSYDVKLLEVPGWSTFPLVDFEYKPGKPEHGRGYFGASRRATQGVTHVPMYRAPVAPASSLGDLISANLVAGSQLPRVVHAFGNSRAHPLIPAGEVTGKIGNTTGLDHSYFLNDALWDRYYFSSVTAYDTAKGVLTEKRSRSEVLEGIFTDEKPALNTRLKSAAVPGNPAKLASKLDGMPDDERAGKLAAHLAVGGPFNLNSTSIDAWTAVLSALRDRSVTAWNNRVTNNPKATPFVRMAMPLASPTDTSQNVNVLGQIRWAGYRSLSDTQIQTLATMIVEEITKRGAEDKAPPLSIAEFVNRRIGSASGLHALSGILQTAIDRSGVNAEFDQKDSKPVKASGITSTRKTGVVTPEAMDGFTGEGSPPYLTQGDLLAALAPIAAVRGDTFKIRAYGEAKSKTGVVEASAWCEVVVQRTPDYVDPADAPETPATSLNQTNKTFGRRFQIVSFRWLAPDEV